MKKPNAVHFRGFTLVELLVVIAIIAILAGAGFQAVQYAMNKAKGMSAMAVCRELEKGVNDFFQEYGAMPIQTDESSPLKTDGTDASGMELLNILLANESGDTVVNVRGIKFIELKEGKNDQNGLIYNDTGTTINGLFDPWGGTYYIMLDGDFDQKVRVQPTAAAASRTLNGRRIAVWSDGQDYEDGAGGRANNDIITW